MKVVLCLGMAFALAGCVTTQEQRQQMATAVCTSEKTAFEWMRCLDEPETRIVGSEGQLMAYKPAAQ